MESRCAVNAKSVQNRINLNSEPRLSANAGIEFLTREIYLLSCCGLGPDERRWVLLWSLMYPWSSCGHCGAFGRGLSALAFTARKISRDRKNPSSRGRGRRRQLNNQGTETDRRALSAVGVHQCFFVRNQTLVTMSLSASRPAAKNGVAFIRAYIAHT